MKIFITLLDTLKKWKDYGETLVYFFIPIISLLAAIVSYLLKLEPVVQFVLFFIAIVLIIILCFWVIYQKQKPIEAYMSLDDAPERYGFRNFIFLQDLGRNDHLTILARTGKSWVVSSDKEKTKHKQETLKTAIRKGLMIDFILQLLPEKPMNPAEQGSLDSLKNDQDEALISMKEINEQLNKNKNDNQGYLRWWYTRKTITNSIANFQVNGNFKRLIYDLDMCFGDKAVVIINEEISAKGPISSLPHKSELLSEDQLQLEIGRKTVEEFTRQYDGYSKRNNSPKTLLPHFARWFQYNKNSATKIPPPVSVQLLLTNTCVNRCIMCSHHALASKDEMRLEEIKKVLRMISLLGTKSIIISGGEPLAHKYIKDILEYAHNVEKLKIGLLTSGVGLGGSVDKELARVIYKTCAWVQVSIDSFNSDTYREIRQTSPTSQIENSPAGGGSMLEKALSSIRNIVGEGYDNLDICYTIQSNNIHEIISGDVFNDIETKVPLGVKVRFKPVHGKINVNKVAGFLPSLNDLENAFAIINENISQQIKDGYLENMIEDGFFSYENLAEGLPTRDKMSEFKKNNYICHALTQTLLITPNGDVYPCCYLFDDNVSESSYRKNYLLGSLKDENTRQVPDPAHRNTLLDIWGSPKLEGFRKTILPVYEEACGKCTRHVRHNKCFNEISKVFNESYDKGFDLSKVTSDPWPPTDGVWV